MQYTDRSRIHVLNSDIPTNWAEKNRLFTFLNGFPLISEDFHTINQYKVAAQKCLELGT